ncbi:MAG: hypothetical protein ACKVZ0_12700 [Gemmatimonadales bacterium]
MMNLFATLIAAVGMAAGASAPTWRARLAATGGSSVAGTVELTVGPMSTSAADSLARSSAATATVRVTGAKPRSRITWFIYDGTCEVAGGIVGGAAAYPPVKLDELGIGQTVATIPVRFREGGRYSVRIHAGLTAEDPVVACGALEPGTT